jgi:hypothetical protein
MFFGLYVVGIMVAVGAVSLVVFYHQKSLKMTSNTMARVVKVEQREVRDEKERRDETLVVVQYKVNDKEYRIEQLLRGRQAARYPQGRSLRVLYNPAQPEMSRIDLR